MARRKTITREDILNAAFKLVATEGFGHFTARNVAQKVGSSTQPIYLEFKNMDDLKDAVYEKIYHYLGEEVYAIPHTGDVVVDMALNFVHFAKREKKLYYSLYLDSATDGERMEKFSHDFFLEMVRKDPNYADLPEEKVESLQVGSFIATTGLASLASSGIIHPTDEEIVALIKDGINMIVNLDHPIHIS